ncbi:MAG: ABC transporter ATP-binding protein/permease [Caldilineales bacterium]|nr:ABC transporter ATP-binding protein/permease [Caldilineales bacterium]MDW8318275.1 ABC transporter ATP-binding protein [Anaerolineae bacterium]
MTRWRIYRRLLAYLQPYWPQVAVAYLAMLLSTVLGLAVPPLIKDAIDQGLVSDRPAALFLAAGLILAIALVRGVTAFVQRFFSQWLTFRVAYDLRNQFYEAVQRLPFAFHDQAHTGDLMSRVTGDIGEAERFVGEGLMDLTATLLLLAGVVVAMLIQDLRLALLALIPFPALIAATLRFGRQVQPLSRHVQDQLGVLSTAMQESLTGIRVVKAFAREPHEFQKFDQQNTRWFQLRERLITVWGNNWPFFTFLLALSTFLLLWFGGPLAMAGATTVGTLFAMISYVLMLNGPIQRLGFLVNLAATADASASRVFEILDTPNTVTERPDAVELTDVAGEVTFEHVSFGYRDGLHVLEDISFTARPGQVIALMGPTGAGKSTVINLIPRFYDPTAGRVLVDGRDVRDVTLKSLRRHIGIVLQEPFLFSATIAENIAYGRPDASMEEIVAAAQAANAHDFIVSFPKGYETRVGERGVTLSGGQKQRIAIARALLYDPRILILDDSTSSVDTETEYLIQQALQRLMQGRTTFIIAQRLLSLKHADQILVLDRGRIVQRGTHEELLRQEGLYRQIYDLQLRDQETVMAQRGDGRLPVQHEPRP